MSLIKLIIINFDREHNSRQNTRQIAQVVARPPLLWYCANMDDFREKLIMLAAKAKSRPRIYRWRMIFLGWLGFLYPLSPPILLLAIGLSLSGLAFQARLYSLGSLALIGCLVLLVTLGWLTRQAQPDADPTAHWVDAPLLATDAPTLTQLVDTVSSRFRQARIRQIRIIAAPNAAIQAGASFWPVPKRQDLLIGLPLLRLLNLAELQTVLIHELAHICHQDARDIAFIGGIAQRSSHLADIMAERWSVLSLLYLPFYRWYLPVVGAHIDAVTREFELSADRMAADWTSPVTLVTALTKISLINRHLTERFGWVERQAYAEPEPPADFQDRLIQDFLQIWPRLGPTWFRELANRPTQSLDSHPSLAERARHLNVTPICPTFALDQPGHLPRAGLDTSRLGAELRQIANRLNLDWQLSMTGEWAALHEAWQARSELAAHHTWAHEAEPNLHYVTALRELDQISQARQACNRLLADFPSLAAAWALSGELLLIAAARSTGDERAGLALQGIAALRQSSDLDSGYAPLAQGLIETWVSTGSLVLDLSELHAWQNRTNVRHVQYLDEENKILPTDSFQPAAIPAATAARLDRLFRQWPAIRQAWLVRKVMVCHPAAYYICALTFKPRTSRTTVRDCLEAVSQELNLSASILAIRHNRALLQALSQVSQARIYPRPPA